ncbi:MAG: glycosyl hydrolase [Bacteroidota bacterium]
MKTKIFSIFLIVVFLIVGCVSEHEKSLSKLEKGFFDPPNSAKPKGYWCLVNGNFDLEQMTKELKEFKEKGIGTLDIWDVAGWVDPEGVIPAGPPFMGDESVQAIAHAIREAGKLGIDIGLTISSSWNAGGSWVKPEDGVMGLFDTSFVVKGPTTINKNIPFPEIPSEYRVDEWDVIKMSIQKREDGLPTFYKDVALIAYQIDNDSIITKTIDISDKITNRKLNWEVPNGEWRVTRYITSGTGQQLMRPSPNSNGLMIDHFSADAMQNHLNFFFEKLESELGDISKTALKYLYTDSYEANSAVWTIKFSEEFKKRNGYDIAPYLPALQGYTVTNDEMTERFLFDYKRTLSDLIIENHYMLGKKMCNEKGIEFIAEAGGPGPPIHNCPFESLSSLGKLSVPRGEFWFDSLISKEHREELQIIKGPASAAHLYGQPRVEAEAFTGTQLWQFGPGDLKSTADRAMCEGLTSFVYHTTPHIPRDAGIPGWVYNFGTIINTTRAWWPLSSGFHNYLARSSFLLQQGNFVGDVLFYYGDKAPNFVEPKHYIPELGFGYDYDVTNSDIILNRLDVKDGKFVLPHGQTYSILVLPDELTINPNVLEKLSQLVKKGGIIVGRKPIRSYSLTNYKENDRRVQKLADEMWKNNNDKIEYGNGWIYTSTNNIRSVLIDQNIMHDVQISKSNPPDFIDFIHRETKNADIYFVRNTTDQQQVYELKLRSTKGSPEIWDADNTSISDIPIFIQDEEFTTIPLKLEANGSTFIVFRKDKIQNNIVKVEIDGKQIFPNVSGTFPISYSNNKINFELNGEYKLSYSDGTVKSYKFSDLNKTVEISGKWDVKFTDMWGQHKQSTFNKLISWTESEDNEIKYFSGIASYFKTFEITEDIINRNNLILGLGSVSKVARVSLNGKELRILWYSPYKIDITSAVKEGENELVIEVANVLSNQMTGDARKRKEQRRMHSNITKGPNAWHTPWRDVPLVESGLLGPVQIKYEKIID